MPVKSYVKNDNGGLDLKYSVPTESDLEETLKSYLPLTGGTLTGDLYTQNVIPTAANTYTLGTAASPYKTLYFGRVNDNVRLTVDNAGTPWLYTGNNGGFNLNGVLISRELRPSSSNTYDIGRSSSCWKDLYLSGNLSDGTNSVTIAEIQKKTGAFSWSMVTNDITYYPSVDYVCIGYLCPLDALYQEDSKADRVAYLSPSCVTIQYSTDGGTTWIDSGYGDASKRLLFGHKSGTYINVGRSSAGESITLTEDNKANYQTRIIINGLNDDRYCKIQSCYLYMTCPQRVSVQLKYTTYGAQDTEVLWRDWTELGGWSGPNKFPLVSKTAWGSNSSNHIYNLILYFKVTGTIRYPTNPGTIGDIRFYGDSAWGSKARVDSPYYKDEYGNIYPRNGFKKVSSLGTSSSFWNNIYGVTLYENGTSLSNKYQTKLSTSQLSAVNSGITSTKVSTYDGYSTTISNKADKTAAVNSLSVSGTTLSYKDVNGTQLGSVTLPSGGGSYTLPTATSSVLGGVKLGSNTVQTVAANSVSSVAERTYAVQKNSSGQMVVNVPWTDTVETNFEATFICSPSTYEAIFDDEYYYPEEFIQIVVTAFGTSTTSSDQSSLIIANSDGQAMVTYEPLYCGDQIVISLYYDGQSYTGGSCAMYSRATGTTRTNTSLYHFNESVVSVLLKGRAQYTITRYEVA